MDLSASSWNGVFYKNRDPGFVYFKFPRTDKLTPEASARSPCLQRLLRPGKEMDSAMLTIRVKGSPGVSPRSLASVQGMSSSHSSHSGSYILAEPRELWVPWSRNLLPHYTVPQSSLPGFCYPSTWPRKAAEISLISLIPLFVWLPIIKVAFLERGQGNGIEGSV